MKPKIQAGHGFPESIYRTGAIPDLLENHESSIDWQPYPCPRCLLGWQSRDKRNVKNM